jgi:hypothetical protein
MIEGKQPTTNACKNYCGNCDVSKEYYTTMDELIAYKVNIRKLAGLWLRFAQYWTTGSGMYTGDKAKIAEEAFDWADALATEMCEMVEGGGEINGRS